MGLWVQLAAVTTVLVSTCVSLSAHAWVITEHTRLTFESVQKLSKPHRAALQAAWGLAREHTPQARQHLCKEVASAAIVNETGKRWCVSMSTLPAVAADHSCSPSDLSQILADEPWIYDVLLEGRRVGADIAAAADDAAALYDIRRDHDLLLQSVDADYADRAEVSSAHYQLVRRSNALQEYLRDMLASGELSNTASLYAAYHAAALVAAARAARGDLSAPAVATWTWRAFVTESFALHFLEDAFSAGHVVGSWGGVAMRKGTHDYYSRFGLEVATWAGEPYVAHGDIYLTDRDAQVVARAGERSLRQLAQVLAPLSGASVSAETAATIRAAALVPAVWDLNVCTTQTLSGLERLATARFLRDVWNETPRPPRSSPAAPRVRTEYGLFIGVSTAAGGSSLWATDGRPAEGDVQGRFGLGLGFSGDGMLSSLMTGRAFVEVVALGRQNFSLGESSVGVGFRVHTPWTFIPGDAIITIPLAYAAKVAWPARQAFLGGALRLNAPVSLGEGARFQFIGGRELTAVWFFTQGAGAVRRVGRWQIQVPAFQLAIDEHFYQSFGNQWTIDLGAQIASEPGLPTFIGPYLTASFIARYFP